MKRTLVGIVPFAKIQVQDAKTLWFLKFIIVLCPLIALRDSCVWQHAIAKLCFSCRKRALNFIRSLDKYKYWLFKVVISFQLLTNQHVFKIIDNIFVNNPEQVLISGNLITDVSDHFSQFCILTSTRDKIKQKQIKKRDLSHFNPDSLNSDLATIDWSCIIKTHANNVDELFSTFYRNFNKIINKHAPIKTLSQRRIKQFSKPWITKGIRTSIKEKNRLYQIGDQEKYKYYRNKICSLTRLSKKRYYCAFFNYTLNNMKKTWRGINKLLNRCRRKRKSVGKMKRPR